MRTFGRTHMPILQRSFRISIQTLFGVMDVNLYIYFPHNPSPGFVKSLLVLSLSYHYRCSLKPNWLKRSYPMSSIVLSMFFSTFLSHRPSTASLTISTNSSGFIIMRTIVQRKLPALHIKRLRLNACEPKFYF